MTPFRFFALQGIVWMVMQAICITDNAHNMKSAMLIFSVINATFAAFNIIGALTGAITGWFPFSREN